MSMTIKQLAEVANKSKSAVRKKLSEDFRAKYTTKDEHGNIIVNEAGCKIILEAFGIKQTADEKPATAPAATLDALNGLLAALQKQLEVKDEQIKELQAQNKSLTAALSSARLAEVSTPHTPKKAEPRRYRIELKSKK